MLLLKIFYRETRAVPDILNRSPNDQELSMTIDKWDVISLKSPKLLNKQSSE